MEYFKEVNFIFLVVGHTKNSADAHFNCLKLTYHKRNIYTMQQLLDTLNISDKVTVVPAEGSDFYDWDGFLSNYYRDFKKMIKVVSHIFSASSGKSRVNILLFATT